MSISLKWALECSAKFNEATSVDLFSDIPKKPKKSAKALSVSQLVRQMKRAIVDAIGKTWIEGEVSNLRKQSSGHWYFSLKDDRSQISCAMFSARNKEGSEFLEDGMKARVFAEATIYEARGQLQIVVEKAEQSGQGDLQARFEALKKKLNEEGLFDQSRKQKIPRYPRTIGIVSSPTGAALQDMLKVLGRRAPWVQPVLFPARVQGSGAEHEIAEGINRLNQPEKFGYPSCDIIIVGRGGGSLEDLWCFNEEVVARAIAHSKIPIISAIGHEIDFTIADFVADLRAPTPSAAAEEAVPNSADLLDRVTDSKRRIINALVSSYREKAQSVDDLRHQLNDEMDRSVIRSEQRLRELGLMHKALHPIAILERRREKVSSLQTIFLQQLKTQLSAKLNRLGRAKEMLRTLGPASTFQRGFSITLGSDGKAIRSTKEIKPGATLRTKLLDGEIISEAQ